MEFFGALAFFIVFSLVIYSLVMRYDPSFRRTHGAARQVDEDSWMGGSGWLGPASSEHPAPYYIVCPVCGTKMTQPPTYPTCPECGASTKPLEN